VTYSAYFLQDNKLIMTLDLQGHNKLV